MTKPCLHMEKRILERISRGIPLDLRPDLVLDICHFPIEDGGGITCRTPCPRGGPYCAN